MCLGMRAGDTVKGAIVNGLKLQSKRTMNDSGILCLTSRSSITFQTEDKKMQPHTHVYIVYIHIYLLLLLLLIA